MGQMIIRPLDSDVLGAAELKVVTGEIASIELLEGDAANTDAEVIQYVNIQKDSSVHAKENVIHVDRFGQKLRCRVKFTQKGVFKFKIKLIPGPNNAVYSATEKARNPNFEYTKGDIEFETDKNGEKIIEADQIFVTPSGGDSFEISAIDYSTKKEKKTAKIKTTRLLYYIEFKMNGLTTITSQLNSFSNQYNKCGIEFKRLPPLSISRKFNIKNNKETQMLCNDIFQTYKVSSNSQYSPYALGIAYTDQLAIKKTGVVMDYANAKGGSKNSITILIKDKTTGQRCFLWNDVEPTEDWFVDCYFIKNGGTTVDKISIPKTCCVIKPTVGYPTGYYDAVEVDLSKLPQEKGTVKLVVDCVDYMRGGLALPSLFPTAAICTRAWWQAISEQDQNKIAIHEIGHKLGMVSDASGALPDKPTYYYSGSGHNGNHCHKGLTAGLSDYRGLGVNSQCVMFGEIASQSSFCKECSEVVRKIDLSIL